LNPHAASVADVLAELDSLPSGLSEDEAARRLQQYGPNRFELTKPVSALKILGDQLRSIVVALLIVAAVISLTLGDWIEAVAIAVVLAINTVIGFVTELRARRAMAALLRLDVPRAFVVRGGQVHGVDAHGLVPGDVIAVNAGQQVPADGRVIEEVDLRSDEASLTGESMPVSKSTAVLPPDTPLADRTNMVYKGTTVVAGTARVLVTATGGRTEIGRIGILTGGVHKNVRHSNDASTSLAGAWSGLRSLSPHWSRCSARFRALGLPLSSRWALHSPSRPFRKHCRPWRRSRWPSVSVGWRGVEPSFAVCLQSKPSGLRRWSAPTRLGR
jgi:magnesium-transporting ATPase (P-type)